jgi:hypothetical protein
MFWLFKENSALRKKDVMFGEACSAVLYLNRLNSVLSIRSQWKFGINHQIVSLHLI